MAGPATEVNGQGAMPSSSTGKPGDEDFDMFAQSRQSFEENRPHAKYVTWQLFLTVHFSYRLKCVFSHIVYIVCPVVRRTDTLVFFCVFIVEMLINTRKKIKHLVDLQLLSLSRAVVSLIRYLCFICTCSICTWLCCWSHCNHLSSLCFAYRYDTSFALL